MFASLFILKCSLISLVVYSLIHSLFGSVWLHFHTFVSLPNFLLFISNFIKHTLNDFIPCQFIDAYFRFWHMFYLRECPMWTWHSINFLEQVFLYLLYALRAVPRDFNGYFKKNFPRDDCLTGESFRCSSKFRFYLYIFVIKPSMAPLTALRLWVFTASFRLSQWSPCLSLYPLYHFCRFSSALCIGVSPTSWQVTRKAPICPRVCSECPGLWPAASSSPTSCAICSPGSVAELKEHWVGEYLSEWVLVPAGLSSRCVCVCVLHTYAFHSPTHWNVSPTREGVLSWHL